MEQIITTSLQADTVAGARLGLTERQVEAAAWAAEGKTDDEIGMIIGRTGRTAKSHVLNAMERTDTHTRAQLVAQLFVNKVLAGKDVVRMAIFSCVLGASWVTAPAVEAAPMDNEQPEQDMAHRFTRRSQNNRKARRSSSPLKGLLDSPTNPLDAMLQQVEKWVSTADDAYTDADLYTARFTPATNPQEISL